MDKKKICKVAAIGVGCFIGGVLVDRASRSKYIAHRIKTITKKRSFDEYANKWLGKDAVDRYVKEAIKPQSDEEFNKTQDMISRTLNNFDGDGGRAVVFPFEYRVDEKGNVLVEHDN